MPRGIMQWISTPSRESTKEFQGLKKFPSGAIGQSGIKQRHKLIVNKITKKVK